MKYDVWNAMDYVSKIEEKKHGKYVNKCLTIVISLILFTGIVLGMLIEKEFNLIGGLLK